MNYLHKWYMFWRTAVVVSVELSYVKKYSKTKSKFPNVTAELKVMENWTKSWKKSSEEFKRGCTLFKHARHALSLNNL